MKKIIVVSFTEETKAIEALHKLNELDGLGDISIYEKIMLRKNAKGEVEVQKDDSDEGWRTLTGMTIGSLLGMFGGPVGLVIGMLTGTLMGGISEISHYDFGDDFISNIENKMNPGTIAIIAEIDEESPVFVDNYMMPLGGVITRNDADADYDDYEQKQIDAIDADIKESEQKLKTAIGEEKEKINKKIQELKAKRAEKIGKTKFRIESNINKLHEQAINFKSKMDGRINEAKGKRIKTKIAGYQEKLVELNKKLKEVVA